ncbi:U3 small nucleolar RNA-associated protein 18-like [Porphyridium purpureum]|uniref:U3 small nucleolar RNA-associated protein 18-like n=1 Tax=Porphyridium purpureum TaxID=35688 RepID=A0A5J4Z7S9_PORPP|nr:U3 small nucleolar RNA-associated protein 18-like [Porphyridium purpureum]|eukprot:POR1778..scf295_1
MDAAQNEQDERIVFGHEYSSISRAHGGKTRRKSRRPEHDEVEAQLQRKTAASQTRRRRLVLGGDVDDEGEQGDNDGGRIVVTETPDNDHDSDILEILLTSEEEGEDQTLKDHRGGSESEGSSQNAAEIHQTSRGPRLPDELDWDAYGSFPESSAIFEKDGRLGEKSTAHMFLKKPQSFSDPADAANQVNLVETSRNRKLRKSVGETSISESLYESRLRDQFQKLQRSGGGWAKRARTIEDKSSLDMLGRTTKRLVNRSTVLPSKEISIRRVKDLNVNAPCKGVVQSTKFHRSGHLALCASLDKAVRIFRVDGSENPKFQAVCLQDMPVRVADFTLEDHSQIVAAGRRSFFYKIDVETAHASKIQSLRDHQEKSLERAAFSPNGRAIAFCGIDGRITLLCTRTLRPFGVLKMNARASCAAFGGRDDGTLLSYGGDGFVYLWDLRMQSRCIEKHVDVGSTGDGLVVAASPTLKEQRVGASSSSHFLYATGQGSGVVNVYDSHSLVGSSGTKQPVKQVMNLTTPVDTLRFAQSGEFLVLASREEKNAMRILHTGCLSVFGNWPTVKTNLRRVNCVDTSRDSSYLSVGNDSGAAMLFQVDHYAGLRAYR